MKQKEFYDCHFQQEFNGIIDKREYKKLFISKNKEHVNKEIIDGIGFSSSPLDYNPFSNIKLKMSKSLKFANSVHMTGLSYSGIIEKVLLNKIISRFNLGKFQLFNLNDNVIESENEYFFIYSYYNNIQDLRFEECEYICYNLELKEFEKANIAIRSIEEFLIKQKEFIERYQLDLRIGKFVFPSKYFEYDVLILNELHYGKAYIKFSDDLRKFLIESKVKCLFFDPFQVHYT